MTDHRTRLTRRQLLAGAAGAAATAVGGTALWRARLGEQLEEAFGAGSPVASPRSSTGTSGAPSNGGRVLVVVQLGGGNDGLNTLVPAADGRYHDARPTLAVPEDRVVALAGQASYGLHPSLAPLAPLWEQGRLAAVEGVGFPGQSRSHFAAMDTWWSAQPGRTRTTGWLGRWLDAHADGAAPDPLRAIALGAGSPALAGERATSTVVLDPARFSVPAPDGADARALTEAFAATATPSDGEPLLAAAQAAVPATLRATDLLARAVSDAQDTAGGMTATTAGRRRGGGDDDDLASLLATAAGIIALGIGTRVIVVGVSGYDTHADQARRHAPLLAELAAGLTAFQATAEAEGWAERVLVMTTSEFGRRVEENGGGTDHGDGGMLFLAGPPVAGARVVGDADLGATEDGDVRSAIDARSVYSAALTWLDGGDGGPSEAALGGAFDTYGLLHP